MIRAIAVFLLAAALPAQEVYDLLLKGGHVIDPKNGRDRKLDIAVSGKKIQKIAPAIPTAHGRNVVDLSDYYITPGLIDIHAYLDPRADPAGVNPDHNALRFGVTTVVDAGSAGGKDFEEFRKRVIEPAKVRVLAFVNIAAGGAVDAQAAAETVAKYPRIIVGIRAPGAPPETLQAAQKAAALAKTVVMADSLDLRPGDIATQIYGRRGHLPDSPVDRKGVVWDAGHGSEGLWFRIAVPAIRKGLLPDTISTGMDSRSVMLPRTTMTNVMSKFLAMGLSLQQIVERATVNPASAIRRPELGTLAEGGTADIAVFELRKGSFGFVDSGHARMPADRELRCILTIRDGEVVWDTEGLSLTDWKKAGPYSNFK